MGVWDTTTPAGSDNINAGDDRIREMKVAIQEALQCTDATLGNAGSFPGSAPSTAPEFAYRGHRGTSAQIAALSADVSGLAFDTDKSSLYSYAGGSWSAVAHLIPAGTNMIFYEASAPTGWTLNNTADDRFLRVETSGGGGTGGSWEAMTDSSNDASTGITATHAHTHDAAANQGGATGTLRTNLGVDSSDRITVQQYTNTFSGDYLIATGGIGNSSGSSGSSKLDAVKIEGDTSGPSTTTVSITDPKHSHSISCTHGSTQHAYANVMICTKDAY